MFDVTPSSSHSVFAIIKAVFSYTAVAVAWNIRARSAESSDLPGFDCPLPIIKVGPKGLGKTKFESAFRSKRPVILHNATGKWAAHKRWKNNGFLHLHGELRLMARPELVHAALDTGVGNTSLNNYLQDESLRHFIFFDFGNERLHRILLPDCNPTPFPLLRIRERVAFTVGRNGTGSGAHQHAENWISQVVGRKAWILAPPTSERGLPEGKRPCNFLKGSNLPADAFVCLIGEGETLYLPDEWHHATCNLDELTVGVGGKGNSADWPIHLFDVQDGDLQKLKQAAASGHDILRGSVEAQSVHYAARGGDVSTLDYLLERRGNPMQTSTSQGGTAAHWAAEAGHVTILQHLLAWSKKMTRQKDAERREPVHVAAEAGCSSCVTFLLSQRASVTSSTKSGNLLSHFAAGSGDTSLLQSLLEYRAKFEVPDKDGTYPLHWAAEHGHIDAARWLLQSAGVAINPKGKACKGCQPIHEAAIQNYPDMLEFLVVQRADFHARDAGGRQPLHWAAYTGGMPVTRRLLKLKADLQIRDGDGGLPIDVASQFGHKEVLKFLKKRSRKSQTRRGEL